MKIVFIISFFYKWTTYSNVRANYEYLQKLGYEVDIYSKKENKIINFNNYDLVMLHGSGSFLSQEDYKKCNVPVISIAWSDPNLFHEDHFLNCDKYFTNDLNLSKKLTGKPIYFYNTACDKRYHKNLNLPKINDILVYGIGQHKFVTNRNQVVNNLRKLGFKIKCFGREWDKHSDTYGFIEGKELIKEINQSHLVLDISNKTTAWPHRILESSACGTPVLTIDREDTRQMFEPGNEILTYIDMKEMVENLKWLQYPLQLKEIGLNAQKRCYKDHDISVRIKELDNIIKGVI